MHGRSWQGRTRKEACGHAHRETQEREKEGQQLARHFARPPRRPLNHSLSLPPHHTHTQQSEAAQEAALRAKYGGLLPKKKVGLPVDHRFFDSADWALSKQQAASAAAAGVAPRPLNPLQPRSQPLAAAPHLPPGLPTGAADPAATLLAPPPKLEPSAPPGPRGPSVLGAGVRR